MQNKVLYLYAGSRRMFYQKWQRGEVPDTQLLGLNHLKDFGIEAEFAELPLAEFLRKINFNLVHLPYLFRVRKYKVVFICAGLPLVFVAKYLLRWQYPKFVIYDTYLTNALKRNIGISAFITRKAIERIDKIVCTARVQRDFLISEGFNPKNILYAPIGIDAYKFSSHQSGGSTSSEKYILSVGRDLGRDYKTLFEAVKDLNVRVKVATKKEAVAGLNIPQNVEILLNVQHEKMPALYAGALFALTPLKNTDPSGSDTSGQYGFLEPMAAGKAVIVSDKPTVRDYIRNEVDGILVSPENPAKLRSAVERLLKDAKLRAALGQRAREKVLSHFISHHFAQSLARVFKQLLEN